MDEKTQSLTVATSPPPVVEEMARNALETLDPAQAVFIRQDIEWIEEGIDQLGVKKNKYQITSIPADKANDTFTVEELSEYPLAFEVREQSSFCCSLCCGDSREFKLGLFPPGLDKTPGWPEIEPLMMLDRPFKCTCWCDRVYCPQELSVSVEGRHLGHIKQENRCIDRCCSCVIWMKSFDANGNPVHAFRSPLGGQ